MKVTGLFLGQGGTERQQPAAAMKRKLFIVRSSRALIVTRFFCYRFLFFDRKK